MRATGSDWPAVPSNPALEPEDLPETAVDSAEGGGLRAIFAGGPRLSAYTLGVGLHLLT